jgi:SAM-dependent methyltransferase
MQTPTAIGSDPRHAAGPRALEYLVVDEFLRTLVDARALRTAFELGLIDRLVDHRTGAVEALGRMLGTDQQGMRFLLDLLTANRVVEENRGDVRLTRRFQTALGYRDLLETKLDFIGFTMNDFADMFTALVRGGSGFMENTRLFQLFDYRRALNPTIENYKLTRAWVRITSTLTRYEAGPCMLLHDFSPYRRMLDVGGNSGEFVLRLCRQHAGLRGTVLDLPLVCDVGMERVLIEPERARISYVKADIRRDQIPLGHDLITFKSMLHDWPPQDARQFIDKAARSLDPGGTLLIYERGPLQVRDAVPPMSIVPTLLFFRSYRPPNDYMEQLNALGFLDVRCREIKLDSPFYVVTGRKPPV